MITLTFNNGLPNSSLKVGDLIYFIKNPNQNVKTVRHGDSVYNFGSGDNASGVSTHILIGEVASIKMSPVANPADINQTEAPYNFKLYINPSPSYVGQVSIGNSLNINGGDYIFFAKNNLVEQSTMTGYYNSVTLMNNSKGRAELFAVSCNIVESSK